MAVNASEIYANHKRYSGAIRWFAGVIREAAPWFAFVAAVAAIVAILARHIGAMCAEAQKWCEGNVDADASSGGGKGAAQGGAAPASTTEPRSEEAA